MLITIDLAAYYDWEPMTGTANEADIMALRAKPGQDGKWLKKVVKETETHTTISLHEAEIQDCMAHFEKVGSPKTRAQTVLWYLTEKVMPHHAHPDHWVHISVHDEPAVESFLNKYFDMSAEDAAASAAPAPASAPPAPAAIVEDVSAPVVVAEAVKKP